MLSNQKIQNHRKMELNLQIKLTPEQLESILNRHFTQKGYDVKEKPTTL